jgi:hypothetical protein
LVVAAAGSAHADPTSGVDVALFRGSYDSNGLFSLEGARLLPAHDLSFQLLVDYARSPIDIAVPGIGTGKSNILNYLVMTDMAFGMSVSDRVAIGIDAAAYRTATGPGYGERGLYGAGGAVAKASTGLLSLRPLTNLDPSASPSNSNAYLGDELAGPLDARLGLKVSLYRDPHLAVAAVGSVFLPFGDENMLLGDRNLVFEPKLAAEWRADRGGTTRVLANVAMRIRERTVLESYDPAMQTADDARAFLDVGSEVVAGLGGQLELTPRLSAAVTGQVFVPLPDSLTYGSCYLYNTKPCAYVVYAPGVSRGDLTTLFTGGIDVRVSADVSASLMVGAGEFGARGDEVHVATGLVWAPEPAGAAHPGAHDRDGDGIPDDADSCPDDPEDKDGFQDEDGCPDLDNDGDGIPDTLDKCPNDPEDKDGFQDADGCPDLDNDNDGIPDSQDKCPNDPEDKDGFQDEDGCPDLDNDNDGFPDSQDKCPNDPETVNGFEDEDGCPDVRQTTGPEERTDRIDLKGQPITFGRDGKLTPAARTLLTQVAAIIKARKLSVRVEVHVPLGVKSAAPAVVVAQKRRDKVTAQRRAALILEFLVGQGVPQAQVQAVGVGSDRPLGTTNPSDPINDRVDFIKAQQ